jgi:predicted lactoylglutathione lyase
MATKIFVNLPVKDLNRSVEFFKKLGFTFNQKFTDDTATCMIISDNIFAMLLKEERFKDFTKKQIADASKTTEALLALDAESKEQVDELVKKAVDAGGYIYIYIWNLRTMAGCTAIASLIRMDTSGSYFIWMKMQCPKNKVVLAEFSSD